MLPNDFVRRVSLQPSRSLIPGNDSAARVEHENCVILDLVNQKPKTFLTGQQVVEAFLLQFFVESDRTLLLRSPQIRARHLA